MIFQANLPDNMILQVLDLLLLQREANFFLFYKLKKKSFIKMQFTFNKMHTFYAYTLISFENSLEEEMATHSSILAWEIPWTEEPGGLQSMGSQRIGQDVAINHHHTLR